MTAPINQSAEIATKLDSARQAATAAIAEAEHALVQARAGMDGTPGAARALTESESTLDQLRAWHSDRIAGLEREHAQALETEAEQNAESEAMLFFGGLLAQREGLASEWKALKAVAKAAEKVLEARGALGLVPPANVSPDTQARLPGYVASLPADHPVRESHAVATAGVRYQRLDPSARKNEPRHVERLAVTPLAALCLPVRGLDDDEGLAGLVSAEATLRGLADALAAGIGRVQRLRTRRAFQAEDAEDDAKATARAELGAERAARLAALRLEFIAQHPTYKVGPLGRCNAHQEQEIEAWARDRYLEEQGGMVVAHEAAKARLQTKVAELGGDHGGAA